MSGFSVSSSLISGHVDAMLLKVISVGDCYGYNISKTISDITERDYEMKEATLYSGLRRLEAEQLIVSYWGDETQGGRRKYYTITKKGRESLTDSVRQWEKTKRVVDKILEWRGVGYEQYANQ